MGLLRLLPSTKEMLPRPPSRLFHLTALVIHRVLPWLLAIALALAVRKAALDLTHAPSLLAAWVELTGHIKATRPLAFLFGAMGVLYGLKERNLRRVTEARLARRIPELERIIQEMGGAQP